MTKFQFTLLKIYYTIYILMTYMFKNDEYISKIIQEYTDGAPIVVKDIIEYFNKRNIADTTKISQLSKLKRVLLDIRQSDELKSLVMPKEMFNLVKAKQNQALEKQMDSPVRLTKKNINIILKWITSDVPAYLYASILLITGRRSSEVYLMAKDIPNQGKSKNSIVFINQLKKRGDDVSYEIPILVKYDVFVKGLKAFKEIC